MKITTSSENSSRAKFPSWLLPVLLGLGLLILVAGLATVGGYLSGISLRREAQVTQVAQLAREQFELGVQDQAQGLYDRARQRFEYVIRLDPNYPGAVDRLAEVLLALNTTATPTLAPTATIQPTSDSRGIEELFAQAQQAVLDSNWDQAIENLTGLRKADPDFKAVDVDGMFYLALRNRGVKKILSAALEEGIYDLTLAQRFGPLDTEAQSLLNGATLYITGASFWSLDWEQVVNYFAQVATQFPGLMDGSKMTATERYRVGLFEYGNYLAKTGKACRAAEQYALSLQIGYSAEVEQAALAASAACAPAQPPTPTTP